MKSNPAISDFPGAMVAACEAALDARLFYNDDFEEFVLKYMKGFGCEAVLMEIAELDSTAPDFFSKQRALNTRLAAEVVAAPRGHYAVVRTKLAHGHSFGTITSDGHGDHVAIGGRYNHYDSIPSGESVLQRMVGYEIYLCRKAIEKERGHQAGRTALAKFGIRLGMQVRDIDVGGENFSTGVVETVHPETGSVKLHLTKRGSRRRWTTTILAHHLAEHARLDMPLKVAMIQTSMSDAPSIPQMALF